MVSTASPFQQSRIKRPPLLTCSRIAPNALRVSSRFGRYPIEANMHRIASNFPIPCKDLMSPFCTRTLSEIPARASFVRAIDNMFAVNHVSDQFVKSPPWLPPQGLPGLSGIPCKAVYFEGPDEPLLLS